MFIHAWVYQRAALRLQSVGLKWEDFTLTDNSCKPHPRNTQFPFNIFSGVQQLEAKLVNELEGDLKSFAKGFTTLESSAYFLGVSLGVSFLVVSFASLHAHPGECSAMCWSTALSRLLLACACACGRAAVVLT